MRNWFTIITIALLTVSCASLKGTPPCPGDPETVATLPDNLAVTFVQSCKGDKAASLQLGTYYTLKATETGDDSLFKKAAVYYAHAATYDSGQTYIYVPGAGNVAGYTMPVNTGTASHGLPEAKFMLGRSYILGQGVEKNEAKGRKLIEESGINQYLYGTLKPCFKEPNCPADVTVWTIPQ